MSSEQATLRSVSFFTAGFFLLWTIAVLVVWKNEVLPDAAQPAFRVVFWGAAVVAWLVATRRKRPLNWLGLLPLSSPAIGWAVGAFALVLLWNVLRVQLAGHPTHLPPLGAGLLWGLVGVIAEELVFRGVIQTALMERLQAWAAITVACLLFLAIHLPGWLILGTLPGPGTIASVFAIGLVCGGLRYWTRSLWPAIGAHWANNLGAAL